MLYVSEETKTDNGSVMWTEGNQHSLVIRDTDNQEYELVAPVSSLEKELVGRGISMQSVVGLFKFDHYLIVNTISKSELALFKLLGIPRFDMRDTRSGEYKNPFRTYGYYNITTDVDSYSYSPSHAMSVASLILQNCGVDRGPFADRVFLGRKDVRILVDVMDNQTVWACYGVSDFNRLQLLCTKYKFLQMDKAPSGQTRIDLTVS